MATPSLSHSPSTPATFTLCVWIQRVLPLGSVQRQARETVENYLERYHSLTEHNYSISLPLGHPIPSIGAPFTPIPDGPILLIEEVQWESNLTPTLILRGEIDADDWAKIKEL